MHKHSPIVQLEQDSEIMRIKMKHAPAVREREKPQISGGLVRACPLAPLQANAHAEILLPGEMQRQLGNRRANTGASWPWVMCIVVDHVLTTRGTTRGHGVPRNRNAVKRGQHVVY